MEKPTQAALSAYDAAFPDDPRAQRKKMFGMPAGFVNGNFFLGVFEGGIVLRLSTETLAEVADQPGVGAFEPRPGAPWREYAFANADTWGGTEQLADWALEALEHTARLPAKVPRPRKPKK